ncbi:oxidoreductase [Patiriisocius marinistellae]|uniref:Oxidoreductase n=1 Tax=Patiriisocius marinistellae TaxID=2494560 RepID=A0A5J4FTN2_9FLAO|nr:NAD(P)H-binding protein [Patiriisocius marinistellae]GEQ84973.1 oxidoreductase [Patiriisocius marinistellae]
MNKTAIILGATGLTGGILLDMLLNDKRFSKIKTFGRSATGKKHPKLEEHLGDMFKMEDFKDAFKGDVVFCCIGTTKAKTPDKDTYKKIDYGIPVTASKLANKNGIDTFLVISALGANPKSSTFYNKVKGEMERDVLQEGIKNTHFFQPSLIGGEREEQRWGEQMAQIAFKTFSFLIPKKYKMIEPKTIAKAMQIVSIEGYNEVRITSDEISNIVN